MSLVKAYLCSNTASVSPPLKPKRQQTHAKWSNDLSSNVSPRSPSVSESCRTRRAVRCS